MTNRWRITPPPVKQPVQKQIEHLVIDLNRQLQQLGNVLDAKDLEIAALRAKQVPATTTTITETTVVQSGGGGGGGGGGGAAVGIPHFNIPLVGEKNNLNKTFTVPFLINLDIFGYPQCTVWWKGGRQHFVAANPQYGQWMFGFPNTIILGAAPGMNDVLVLDGIEEG